MRSALTVQLAALAALIAIGVAERFARGEDAPASPASVDLDLVAAQLEPLVRDPAFDPPDGWFPESARSLLHSDQLPKADRDAVERGFVEGRWMGAMVYTGGFGPEFVSMSLRRFRSAEAAHQFVAIARKASELDDTPEENGRKRFAEAKYEDGAGPTGRLDGFVAAKRHAAPDPDSMLASAEAFTESVAVARLDALVVVLTSSTKDVDRAAFNEALARVETAVRDPAAARKAPKPPPFPLKSLGRLLSIRILGDDGSEVPRANAFVSWSGEGRMQSRAVVAADGHGLVARVPRVPSKVTIWGARAADDAPLPWGPGSADVGDTADSVEVRLPAESSISGVVVDADGKPAAGVLLAAIGPRGSGPPGVPADKLPPGGAFKGRLPRRPKALGTHGCARSGADGSFRIGGLGREPVAIVTAEEDETWLSTAEVTAKADATGVRVAVERAADAVVTVVDPAGRPVEGAGITLVRIAKHVGEASWERIADHGTDSAGVARFRGVRASLELTLEVRPPDERPDLAPFERADWRPAPTTVTLDLGKTLEGTVRGPDGPTEADIEWKAKDGRSGSDRSVADGSFRLERVPRVEVVVTATKEADGVRIGSWRTSATVAADVPRVDLVLPARPAPPPAPPPVSPPTRVTSFDLPIDGVGVESYERVTLIDGDAAEDLTAYQGHPISVPPSLVGKTVAVWVSPRRGKGLLALGVKLADPLPKLALVPLQTIRGHLVGVPAAHADIAAVGPARVTVPGTVAADGQFTVEVPPGHYVLRAKAKSDEGWVYAAQEVDAGATDVEVRFPARAK